MAIDMDRVVRAAAQAALEDGKSNRRRRGRRRRLPAPLSLVVGAGIVTAGRVLVRLRGQDVVGGLQQRLLDYERRHLADDEAPEDEADVAQEVDEDEPFDEEPEGEHEDEYEDEPSRPRSA